MSVGSALVTPRRRLAWFAAAVFVVLFGLGEFGSWVVAAWQGHSWWGIDLHLILDAGARLSAGQPIYADPRFLYPPLAAAVGAPLAPLDFDAVSLAYAAGKLAIAAACVWSVGSGWSPLARVLVLVTLICSLPFLHDLMLGNVNVLLVGAMVPAMLASPRPRHGILLGLVVAAFAKPLVVPILLWLLVWRRPLFGVTVLTGLVATALGALVAGPGSYVDWLHALSGGTRFASPFAGNHGVTALFPDLWLPVAAITAVGLVAVLLRRGRETGIAWAAASGILIAPYAGTYSALPIALALPGMYAFLPTLALVVVAASPIATTHPLPIYAAAILVGALRYRETREPEAVPVAPPGPAPVVTLADAAERL